MRKINVFILGPFTVAGLIHSCLLQNFHGRSGKNDQRRSTFDKKKFCGFSQELFFSGCGPCITRCQTYLPWVALPGTRVSDRLVLTIPVATS